MSDVLSTLHSAYSFIRSVESNNAIGALTLDHLIQDQINLLKQGSVRTMVDSAGLDNGTRISRWDQLNNLQNDMDAVIKSIDAAGTDEAALAQLGLTIGNVTNSGGS